MKKFIFLLFFIPLFYVFAAERQVVISKVDIGLQNSDKYDFTTLSPTNTIKGVDGTSLDLILEFQTSSEKNFTYNSTTGKYSYPYTSNEKYIVLPVTYNSLADIKIGNIKLIEESLTAENDLLTKVLIDETINLPGATITLKNSSSAYSGDLFTYSENSSLIQQHFEKFKIQEYMIRISRGTGDYNYDAYNKLNKIKPASTSDSDFLNKTSNYIDFYFNGDDYTKIQKIITPKGLEAIFIPGRIELFGLPKEQYTITLYSFRYSTIYSDKGSVVVTRESNLVFNSSSMDLINSLIINSFDSVSHPKINAELILISPTANPTFTIKETYGSSSQNITPTSTTTPLTVFYYDSGGNPITPNASGYDAVTNKYYYKVSLSYSSTFTAKDTIVRTITLTMGTFVKYINYTVKFDLLPKITTYPYQTVIAKFTTPLDFGSDPYTIIDNVMSSSTYGYKGIKYINSSSIKDTYLGNYSDSNIMTFDGSTYQWTGVSSTQQTIMLNKSISDSKGTYHKTGSSSKDFFTFYTLKNIQSFIYEQENSTEIPENATFLWQDSLKSSYDAIVSDDELIFRITKLGTGDTGVETKTYTVAGTTYTVQLPKFYLDVYNNINPIGTYNETTNVENFVSGSKPYLDLIFKKGEDRKFERANAIFSFFKDNKLDINGLPRGDYMLQVYTVKNADLTTQKNGTLDYKTITFETNKVFAMGLPELVYGDFANMNNLFLIESINVNSSFDINTNLPNKKIKVNFITKTSEAISLARSDLTAQNLEEPDGGIYKMLGNAVAERHSDGQLIAIPDSSLSVYRADQLAFQFPLDIIFLIDDSGSMQNEIDNVKNSLSNFSSQLEARGYNVKFNLITFGPDQNAKYSGIGYNYPVGSWVNKIWQYQDSGYLAIYKSQWFTDVTELTGAFDQIRAIGGYYDYQENGAQAIYNGATMLVNNGRYLDYSNKIVDNSSYQSGFIPSKKLLILLSDENFDIENLSLIPGVTGGNNTKKYNSYRSIISNLINSENISLNAIYHIGTGQTDKLGNAGVNPADTGDKPYNDFMSLLGNRFSRYEMGSSGQLVIDSLTDTVKNTGIIQRWILSYDSPFINSDGLKRQVIFSISDLKNILNQSYSILPYIKDATKDRFYTVPEDKIEAYFVKPDPVLKKIVKKDGKIELEVRGRSQYNEVQTDGTTKLVNYPIIKGSLKLTGNGHQLLLLSDSNEITISPVTGAWYSLKAVIDSTTYYSLFGDNPIDIEATVATKYYGDTINLSSLKLIELDEPLITSIKIENETLKILLEKLFNEDNQRIYTDSEIETLSSIKITNNLGFSKSELNTIFSTVSNKLNIKINDKINYEIVVVDESISGTNDSNIYIGGVEATVSKIDSVYNGSAILNSTDTSMRITIIDDFGNISSFKNNGISEPFDALTIPIELSNSSLIDNSVDLNDIEYFSSLNTSSTSTNKALLTTEITDSNSLAYLIRFDYDGSQSDYGLSSTDSLILPTINYPNISAGKYWIAAKNGNFNLYDGKYQSTAVYLINKAGAIKTVNASSIEDILTKLSLTLSASAEKTFYVDTVMPRIINAYVEKTQDLNIIPLTGVNKPFKGGDSIRYIYEVEEFNFDYTEDNYTDFINTLGSPSQTVNTIFISSTPVNQIENSYTVIVPNPLLPAETKAINMTTKVYDKANNSNSVNNSGTFDNKLPKQLLFTEVLIGNYIKYTNDKNLTINSIGSGENIAYAEITLGSTKGTLISSLPVYLNDFSLNSVENINNMGTLITYSSSGMKGIPKVDSIVVDTVINHNGLTSLTAKKGLNNKYIATIRFDQIKELVGLNGFKIIGTNASVINGVPDGDGFFPITGTGYFIIPTTSNTTSTYNIELSSVAVPNINIELRDRLNNTKILNQDIDFVSVYQIIGSTSDSERTITTKIESGIGFKIISRE